MNQTLRIIYAVKFIMTTSPNRADLREVVDLGVVLPPIYFVTKGFIFLRNSSRPKGLVR